MCPFSGLRALREPNVFPDCFLFHPKKKRHPKVPFQYCAQSQQAYACR
jgi:hypothetical protein